MKNFITLITLSFQVFTSHAFGYHYEKKVIDSHIIHILRLDPGEYQAEIIKAGGKGRETVSSMAKKAAADIAINAGFFEIGGDIDGNPSGSLVIKGKVYNIKKGSQPLVVIKSGILSLQQSAPENDIPSNISFVSGIPMLINNGQIPEELFNKKSTFYTHPHARTALGVDSGNRVIIVVAEHSHAKDLTTITMGELRSLIKTKGQAYMKKYSKQDPGDLTLNEVKEILRDEYSPKPPTTQGLTMLELAKLMQDLGCRHAINLDGGGSTTLWIDHQVVNTPFGDKDESMGAQIERPVSDAIIFKKRCPGL